MRGPYDRSNKARNGARFEGRWAGNAPHLADNWRIVGASHFPASIGVPVLVDFGFGTSLALHPESLRYSCHGHRRIDQFISGSPAGSNSPDPVPQKVGSSLQSGFYEPDYEPFRRPTARLRHCYTRRSKIRSALPDAGERFSRTRRISDRADLRAGLRVGQECTSRWGLPAGDSRRTLSAFRTNHRA
jgi:hypothetical protein